MAARKAKPKSKPARKAPAARAPARKAGARKAPAKKPAGKPAAPKLPPKWSAAAKSEFDAIQARAAALSSSLKREDFDDSGNPRPGPWATMLADLHAWAKKHKIKLETHEHAHEPEKGGAPAGGATPYVYAGGCPGSFTKTETKKHYGYTYVYTYKCTLRRQTWLGRCVYDCTSTYELQP